MCEGIMDHDDPRFSCDCHLYRDEESQCPTCGGEGRVPLREHFVTHDMALDACEPAMEGMSMGIEYGACPECGGTGDPRAPEEGGK